MQSVFAGQILDPKTSTKTTNYSAFTLRHTAYFTPASIYACSTIQTYSVYNRHYTTPRVVLAKTTANNGFTAKIRTNYYYKDLYKTSYSTIYY